MKLPNSTAPLGGSLFTNDLAIEKNYAVIGAPRHGKAFIFDRTGSTWSEVKILTVAASLTGFDENVCESVAIQGTVF